MDKEVIIDGVNVAGCEYYMSMLEKDVCRSNRYGVTLNYHCYDNPNCYYKQLQRKEQECEQERITKKHYNQVIKELSEQLQRLQAENEELKGSVLKQCPNCGEEFLNPKGCELYDEKQSYKQALESVKFCIGTIISVDGHWFDEAIKNEFNYITHIINEVLKDE